MGEVSEKMMNNDQLRKLRNMCVEDRRRMVFQWVKTGVITLKEFDLILDELLLGS